MEPLNGVLSASKGFVNNQFIGKEPWQIVSITATSVLAGIWLWETLSQPESLTSRIKKRIFKLSRKIPLVAKKIDEEMKKVGDSFEKDAIERARGIPYIKTLAEQGMDQNKIVSMTHQYLDLGDYQWKEGFVSGAVYAFDQDLIEMLTKIYGLASYTNPLHSDIFPGICKMEAEVIRMAANLFHGGPASCGSMTSGGTESILMACKAYRDFAREERGVKYPEMVLPRTGHPAFEKAAAYFNIAIRHIPVDPLTTKVDIRAMKRAIGRNTIMLVGSVPNYPYGTMDDIEEISRLGMEYGVPVHVDCCLGGFLAVFMPRAGYDLPPFDFRLPGVTSISADTHKYGYAPKGSSLVLYSELKFLHHQFCVTSDWPGGVYGSPSVNGSRAGGIVAACWATLMYFGMEGYVSRTKKIVETCKYITKELRKIDTLFVFGEPVTSVIAIGSNRFHIYRLAEYLQKLGWNLNPLQYPPGIHICLTTLHTADGVADRFIRDVKSSLAEVMKEPDLEVEGKMAIYGQAASIPDRSIVEEFTRLFIDSSYATPDIPSKGEGEPHQNGTVSYDL